ncbi:MAG: DUF1574 domain-containing protein [Oscillatoriophycideae cyanobacterium NC_groundwater_1537_Pr4_S-0.65um_50_18]|nr:DUF1574 domain-containing protein [Oscillatoriophycideae cyanobacterium NC_groundwater_1537_Pr4_S-0.65um_50_18]
MSNAVDNYSSNQASALGRWIVKTFEPRGLSVKFRLRGNNLHLLCQAQPCPDRTPLLLWLIPVLQKTDLNTLLPAAQSSIYRVQVYGSQPGAKQPEWTASVHLNQLDHHFRQIQKIADRQSASPQLGHPLDQGLELPQSGTAKVTSIVSRTLLQEGTALTDAAQKAANQAQSNQENSALALSNRSLAQKGEEVAIASYLSETLSDLGVAVRVSAKTVPYLSPSAVQSSVVPLAATTKRLWIACGAAYSPDLSLVGEPITRRLRELEIQGYRDAVIVFQVAGEIQPDWKLRVDLTPPSEMLREWGRWGDVEALQRLLNQAGATEGLRITTASLKESTLHLFCALETQLSAQPFATPDLERSRQWVNTLLESLAPQGIHAATLYGQRFNGQKLGSEAGAGAETPAWIDWLKLPASLHPALSESAMVLAHQGDWEAIAFLLHRLLNPDLDRYLTTGGIRLQLLPKQDLLHVMSEAPICPEQHRVGQTIAKFLRLLKLPSLAGVRIYGRRSGQKLPLWSFGVDFVSRHRLVPEAAPEFVATDNFVHELVTPADESALRPDLTPADIQSLWRRWQQRMIYGVEKTLVRSLLFTPTPETQVLATAAPSSSSQSTKTAVIWGMAGILLMLNSNWLLSQVLQANADSPPPKPIATQPAAAPVDTAPVLSSTLPTELSEPPSPTLQTPLPQKLSLQRSPKVEGVFNSEGFTQTESPTPALASPDLPASAPAAPKPAASRLSQPPASQPPASSATSTLPYTPIAAETSQITAAILAAAPTLPSLNSHQLNEKLKLYYQYLEENGNPDVLVIGSSRALRGIDPIALKQSLAELGYADLKIFNFGINGATAQVADLLVRQLLTPDQLPRLILWADGARAFNSGNGDVTFNGIVASEGYQQMMVGQFPIPRPASAQPQPPVKANGINLSLTNSYEALDHWFSDQLAQASGTYGSRDRLKRLFQVSFSRLLPAEVPSVQAIGEHSSSAASPLPQSPLVNPDGFLPLGMQFNPATYYQKYARVIGQYDSDYEGFRIAGRQETALRSLLQYTQSQEIPIVFVNLPLTEDYLDPIRRQHEQTFKDYMVKTSMSQPGLIFRDLGEIWTTKYSYFSDPSHLNRYGAYAVSQRMAQDPLIPWVGKAEK